ncbi:MAG: hypothetical protein Q8Q25_01160, partial [bacterium]|nr:hypothetical protein [bacterium]
MKASGIILIEVLIGTAIAAIVSTLLIGAWYQTNRFSLAVDESVLLYTRASMLAYQLERDISGAFVPELDMQQIEKQPTKEPLAPKTEQEKKPKPLEKIFYGENSEGQLKLLTFITNNPLQVYWGPSGKPKIRIARVVYTLEPNKEEKGSYILYRQEGQELDFKAYKEGAKKTVRRYELVRGIKHMTVEYTIIEEQKDKEKPKEPAKREYKEFKKWED